MDQGRDSIHGHTIPDDHVCVLVLAVVKNTPAPFVIDDSIEEQRFLVPVIMRFLGEIFGKTL